MDEEMTVGQKAEALLDWIKHTVPARDQKRAPAGLSEALYTLSEAGYFERVDVNEAMQCWLLVEALKTHGGPLPRQFRL